MRITGRLRLPRMALACAGLALVATACPQEPPASPTWHGTRYAYTPSPAPMFIGAWTSTNWFATLRIDSGATTVDLLIHPRIGPGGSPGAPQTVSIPPTLLSLGGTPRGDDQALVLSRPGGAAGGDPTTPTITRFVVNQGGTWSLSPSVFSHPGSERLIAAGGGYLVYSGPLSENPAPVDVSVYSYTISGSAVTVTPLQTIAPDPAWSPGVQALHGRTAAIDGGLLAIATNGDGLDPGATRVYRLSGGVFTQVFEAPTLPITSISVDVDDSPGTDRVAFTRQSIGGGDVVVYADNGSGFALETTIDPSVLAGGATISTASTVALDGDLLATSGRPTNVTSATPGHAPVPTQLIDTYRLSGGVWNHEAALQPADNPVVPGNTASIAPAALDVAGNHVAVNNYFIPDPAPGCSPFTCFTFGFESWSFDKY